MPYGTRRVLPIETSGNPFGPAGDVERLKQQLADIEDAKRRKKRDQMDREHAERLRREIRDKGHEPVCSVKSL